MPERQQLGEGDILSGRNPGPHPRNLHQEARWALLVVLPALAGCGGLQSSLDPHGAESATVANLFWIMVVSGAVIWAGVIGVLLFAVSRRKASLDDRQAGKFILWGGAVFPSVTLLALLSCALWLMPGLRPFATPGDPALRIDVKGNQFWWQVAYNLPDGRVVHAANEIRMPVGERVEFTLTSDNVIHSFWIPALGGKMDMIPGRTNRLSLLATKQGTFRAACAEYCGTSHALMAFAAVATPPAEFDRWLAGQAAPSPGAAAEGLDSFLRNGCGACHRVAGTPADTSIGPDLSHVGSRLTIGAGILPNTKEAIAGFIADPSAFKPEAKMPAFGMLPDEEIETIATWLGGLK